MAWRSVRGKPRGPSVVVMAIAALILLVRFA
jgi:hypothetical protein